jgi:hypothetical protein
MKSNHLFAVLCCPLLAMALSSCGGASSSSSSSKPSTTNFTYSMTAQASEFAVGRIATVVDQPYSAGCVSPTGPVVRSEGLITTAGVASVPISLSLSSFTGNYDEVIYVDVQPNHRLDDGDLIIGMSSSVYGYFCNAIGEDNINENFNLDALATELGLSVLAWTGGTEPFSVDPSATQPEAPEQSPNLGTLQHAAAKAGAR